MIGIELKSASRCWRVVQALLRLGVIALGGGTDHNVLTITPPFIITERQLQWFVRTLNAVLAVRWD
jgi:4-aminobutyrate aminotransferase-like enzyme